LSLSPYLEPISPALKGCPYYVYKVAFVGGVVFTNFSLAWKLLNMKHLSG
jgi:hypothetical protein